MPDLLSTWEDRFSMSPGACRSLLDGTLKLKAPIVIPPDPPGKVVPAAVLSRAPRPVRQPAAIHRPVPSCLNGGAHDWRPRGIQAYCKRCDRFISLRDGLLIKRVEVPPPVVISHPELLGPCVEGREHRWRRASSTGAGQKRAGCKWCRMNVERINNDEIKGS